MGSKREHHYVPRFYLRHFASKPDRINIHVIKSSLSREDVGLREQCRRARFHGMDDRLENRVSEFEDKVAPVVSSIVQTSTLPRNGSSERLRLAQFIAVQVL